MPRDIVVSAVFQNISGPTITASYAATNAQIAPSLGRNLAACGGAAVCTSTATVPLIVPQTMFDDRLYAARPAPGQADRADATGHALQGNFNIYNVFNGSASSTLNTQLRSAVAAALAAAGRPHGPVQRKLDVLKLEGQSAKVESAK